MTMSVECTFTSHVSIESGMLVTYCMQCVMSVSSVAPIIFSWTAFSKNLHSVLPCIIEFRDENSMINCIVSS